MPKYLRAMLALFVLAAPVAGQQPPDLITDRPDFTESTSAVPVGSAQLELGSTWERAGGANSVSGAEALVRWGVHRGLELRFTLPDYVDAAGVSGWSDAAFGAKVELGEAAGWELGLVAGASVPLGDTYGVDGTQADLILAAGRDLTGAWSLGTQLSGTWSSDAEELDLAYTAVLGLGLSEAVGTFVEVALSPIEAGPRAVLVHHGYTFLIAPSVQLDLHAAVGLSDTAPDALVGVGLSTRVGG